MKTIIGMTIDTEGVRCGLDCQWLDVFGTRQDSDDPCPRCSLCDRFLNEDSEGTYRCGDCQEMERTFVEEARRLCMREAVQNKANGVRLLEATGYKIDVTSFESVAELFKYLIERRHVDRELMMELTGLKRDEIDLIMEGREYPYLLRKVQATIGVPSPTHITSDEEMAMSSQLLRGSEK